MAVGRGSMERAAKAAGTDTAAKKTGDRAQTPYRRLTISEIVGETSLMEPPGAGSRAGSGSQPAARKPETGKPVLPDRPVPEKKPIPERQTISARQPDRQTVENRDKIPEKATPMADAAVAPAVEKPEPGALKAPKVPEPTAGKAEVKAPEISKASESSKVSETPRSSEAPKVSETLRSSEALKTSQTPEEQKIPRSSETSKMPAPDTDAAERKETQVVRKREAEGQIVYQKSSGMLERAAEPNERFGLGDAMPVYYF